MNRPKAVDGVVVHRTRKTRATASPKKVTLSENVLRRRKEIVEDFENNDEPVPLARRISKKPPVVAEPKHIEYTPAEPSSHITKIHIGIAVVAVTAVVIASSIFGRAVITVTPKQYQLPMNVALSQLQLKDIEVTDTVVEELPASGSQAVERPATGRVTLYNTGTEAQKLSPKTRLQDKAGKIYYITSENITIPAGTATVPGTVDVDIVASVAGPEYNGDATDFTFPGWKETKSPKFTTQYARSISTIAGGYRGAEPTIDPVELERIKQVLKSRLASRLNERAMRETPNPWSVVPGSAVISEGQVTTTMIGQVKARVELSGVFSAQLVNRFELGSIAARTIPELVNRDVVAANIGGLQLDTSKTQISGTVTVEPIVLAPEIERAALGKNKKELYNAFSSMPLISGAEAKLHPAWKSSVPGNSTRVEVEIRSSEAAQTPQWP